MTYYTSPDNLPAPDDYQQPADSPAAFRALADSVQAAITATKNFAQSRITQNWGNLPDFAISQQTVTNWKNAIEARLISAGWGLSGGGSLADSRTLSVDGNVIASVSRLEQRIADVQQWALGAFTQHGHGHDLGYAVSVHGPFTIPSGTDQNYILPHGLGAVPRAAAVTGLDDDGMLTVLGSIRSMDGANCSVNIASFGSGAETFRISLVVFR